MDFLTINHAAELSGITAHTLRAWEKRYQAIVPGRTHSGRRTYSFADVEKLRLLKQLTDNGFTISQIANLPLRELKKLNSQNKTPKPKDEISEEDLHFSPLIPTDEIQPFNIDEILEGIRQYDLAKLFHLLSHSRITLGARAFIFDVVCPLLNEVGRLVNDGHLSVAQEHAASALIGGQIHQIIQSNGFTVKPHLPKILLATPEGEIHEFGILISQVICCNLNLTPYYLGSNMPVDALAESIKAIKPSVVIIGSSLAPKEFRKHKIENYIELLYSLTKEIDYKVWVGGPACFENSLNQLSKPVEKVYNFIELEKKLLLLLNQRKNKSKM